MRKTLKLGLIALLVISVLLSIGIMTAAGATETTIDTITVENGGNLGTKIDYNPTTKTMTFTYVGDTSVNYELQPVTNTGDYSVQNFIDKYRTEVEHIEIGYFKKIALVDVSGTDKGGELFAGMTALKSVHFAKNQILQNGLNGPGFFRDCESLTTIWFGDDANKIEGCANFTDSWSNDQNYKDRNNFPRDLFKGCVSLEKIIYTNNAYEFTILSTTFEGCANLREVTIGSNITTIADDAFDSTGVLVINAPEGSAAAGVELPTLLERIEAFKAAGNKVENEGYCGVSQTVDSVLGSYDSNVKWEVYNIGSVSNPKYTLYFYIDSESENTASTIITSFANVAYADAGSAKDRYVTSNGYVSGGWQTDYGSGKYHRWHSDSVPATSISTIVIGDGITKLTYNRGTFSGMTGIEVVECPSTFKEMQGAQFKGCSSLETLYTRGVNTPVIGTVNLSNFSTVPLGFPYDKANYGFAGLKSVKQYVFKDWPKISAAPGSSTFFDNESLVSITLPEGVMETSADMFGNCYSLKEVTLPATCTNVAAKTFTNCTSLEEITFLSEVVTIAADSTATSATGKPGATAELDTNAFKNCTALTTLTAPYGSDAWNFAYEHGFSSTHMYVSSKNHYGRYVIDPDTHHFSITDTGYSPSTTWRQYDEDEAELLDWLEPYRESVLTASVAKFGKVVTQAGAKSIFEDMINLTEVQFAANQRFASAGSLDNNEENRHGLFKGCSSLKTVWLGDESFKKENVVDLSYIDLASPDQDNSANILYYMFNGCSSIEKVILPELVSYYKNEILREPKIWASSFAGCTYLKTLNIPEGICIIENGSFKDCTALEEIDYYASASLIGGSTFTGSNNGLVMKVQSYEAANTINKVLGDNSISADSVRAFYKNGISIDGYQVRTSGYNGLRTIFSFYENAFEGYELIEFGTITATKTNFELYSESFGNEDSVLQLVEGEFKTPVDPIIKTPIYMGGEYVNNHAVTDTGVKFAVTVVRFENEDQYKAEIINCGYEIWEKDGSYFVYFTREDNEGYKTNSLYKTTFGMLRNRVIIPENSDNPVWNVLMKCEHTTFAPQTGINGYYFEDPLDSSKKIALYMTDSETSITLENIGFDLSEKPSIGAMVFGKNVEYDLPLIDDDYWQAELDSQLAKIPEGKSFIAFTDFHFELDGTRNTRKATELMKYVKTITGIDTIINLGDTYTGEPTIEECRKIFSTSVGPYFYDVFGTDGLYAVGNHESNITTWGGAKADNSEEAGTVGKYAYDVLLPDTDIYNETVANLYDQEGFVFDTALIEMAESGEISFSAVGPYNAEQMKAEYVAWAKMHYYYDDIENGIRYIIYNSGSCGLTEKYTLGSKLWNSIYGTQLDFIAGALMSVPSGYDVVLAGHMLGSSDYNDNTNTRDVTIYKLLSAFKSRSTFSETVNSTYWGNENMAAVVGDSAKSYDFTNTDFTGTVFTIGGHWHVDFSCVYGTDSDGNYQSNKLYTAGDETPEDAIFWIGLNNDCLEALQSYEKEPTAVTEMVKGTNTENCFNVITIKEDGSIVVTRFGAGDDRTFTYTQKKTESVSYAEGMSFAYEDSYSSTKKIDAFPKTYEAVITLPEDYSGRAGVIFGTYGSGNPNFNFEISENGKPRLYLQDASGTAKSVYPNVDVRCGEPVHIAITIENFDSEAQSGDVKCYINGELKTTDTDVDLRADFSVAGIRLGGDHREKNAQYFKGSITCAAAYADARTAEEIAADYASFGSDRSDIIFCYDLSSGENGKNIADISGNGYDLTYQYVGFFTEKAAVTDYAYSMAIVGDTQKVSVNNPANFSKIYDYILDNVTEKNIQFVIGLGDITDKDTDTEWELDIEQIQRMDGVVPYSLVRGNHDSKTQFDKYVSYENYKDDIAGAYEEESMLNTYYTFSVGEIKYMVMCLDYGASDEVLTWAGKVIAENPDHNVIVTTHAYLFRDGTTLDANDICPPSSSGDTYNNGDDIWDKLIKNHENIVLVLSGHDPSREIVMAKTEGVGGNTVTQILIDPQGVDAEYASEGGCGLVAMFYFSEDGKTVQVEYYSTIKEQYYMYSNQFTFELDVVSAS